MLDILLVNTFVLLLLNLALPGIFFLVTLIFADLLFGFPLLLFHLKILGIFRIYIAVTVDRRMTAVSLTSILEVILIFLPLRVEI